LIQLNNKKVLILFARFQTLISDLRVTSVYLAMIEFLLQVEAVNLTKILSYPPIAVRVRS
jgi:hypothetical protein